MSARAIRLDTWRRPALLAAIASVALAVGTLVTSATASPAARR